MKSCGAGPPKNNRSLLRETKTFFLHLTVGETPGRPQARRFTLAADARSVLPTRAVSLRPSPFRCQLFVGRSGRVWEQTSHRVQVARPNDQALSEMAVVCSYAPGRRGTRAQLLTRQSTLTPSSDRRRRLTFAVVTVKRPLTSCSRYATESAGNRAGSRLETAKPGSAPKEATGWGRSRG